MGLDRQGGLSLLRGLHEPPKMSDGCDILTIDFSPWGQTQKTGALFLESRHENVTIVEEQEKGLVKIGDPGARLAWSQCQLLHLPAVTLSK